MILPAAQFLFIAWAVFVAVCDCRNRRIPNSIVAAGLVAAILCLLFRVSPFGLSAGQATLGFAVGLFGLLPFFALGVMGAADVKVFAVLGAWCGIYMLLGLWIVASIAAGLHAVWLLVTTRTKFAAIGQQGSATFVINGKASTPYGALLTLPAVMWLGLQIYTGALR